MDNFSQNVNGDGEKENNELISTEFDDIQFEEPIDIAKLQKTLQENPDIELPEDSEEESQKIEVPAPIATPDKNAKKYVIYINPDNVDFIENLSIAERRDLINKILKEQNEISIKKKELDARKQYVINLILACLTFLISLPLLFILVNKSTESTIINYQQAKTNFSRLYREKGKIKRQDIPPAENVDY